MTAWLEQAWMERYLERQLADDEAAWFETYLLDKPHLHDQWSADLALRDGSRLVQQEQTRSAAPAPDAFGTPTPTVSAHAHALASRRRRWRLPAVAASLAVAFGAGLVLDAVVRSQRADPLIADPTRIVIDASRGAGTEHPVENASSRSEFVLIDALVPPEADYVAVRGPGMPERRLTVSKDGVATLLLRRSDADRIGPLTLVVKAAGHEFEKPLSLKQLQKGDHP
jgi:hypothetical protein